MRWLWLMGCAFLGLVMLICGLLMPVYLRAVDANVLKRAERRGHSLVEDGLALARDKQVGAAEMVSRVAQAEHCPEREPLELAVTNLARAYPHLRFWGGAAPRLESLFGTLTPTGMAKWETFTDFAVRAEHREKLLEALRASPRPAVRALLQCQTLTNTVLFSPSASASGQALDTAIAVCGLLADEGRLTREMQESLVALVAVASGGGSSERLEQALMDFLALGRRFNWEQLAAFSGHIESPETLDLLARQARQAETRLPALFTAVVLSSNPAGVARYLMNFSQTGLRDLGFSLRFGIGGLRDLLLQSRCVYRPGWRLELLQFAPLDAFYSGVLDYCWLLPRLALAIKGLLILAGGFCLAMSLHFARFPSALDSLLQVRGFHVAREFLFALGFLLVVLLLSEPFLSQESQKVEFPFRLHLPMLGAAVPAGKALAHSTFMIQLSLLTMLLFFVLQALLYTACLVRLAEVRRQDLVPRIKLKLLDNEEHLFDAGLYLGFVGTIISLILVSLGVIQPSLMAAYSSTSFGIIFVSIFKIFHLRPLRRNLLLQAEGMCDAAGVPLPPAKPVASS